ncbi:hypothetical protein FQ775_07530 [Nitratireductor mangrovi]|uniref:Uncharacterized protein n=1 Tax=Nitratireductor mangrovi TaxID=2599600 RepID=A0A5B8KXM3_9HYPH|nr:hypothetical protein [Nitratireductor mangrovi]QDZ00238.1 hypothetical protein FQ775_07530 [Nitratireductor mangrovi]
MIGDNIRSADEVVTAFIDQMAQSPDLEPKTVAAVKALRDEGKLTKTNLLRSLEADRASVAPSGTDKQDFL